MTTSDTHHAPTPGQHHHQQVSPDLYAWHEQTDWEVEAAWHDGYQQALHDIAARTAELAATWAHHGHRQHRDHVADRIADMETLATQQPSTWRGRYPGGPVDWQTGRLAQPMPARPQVGGAA